MRSNAIIRCGVLLLTALLAIDASWCCDGTMNLQSSAMAPTSADDGSAGDGGQLDCHACICSGLALVETIPVHVPMLVSTALPVSSVGAPVSETPSIDVPPDKRG